MKNELAHIGLTNVYPGAPVEMRGTRYTFANNWSLSVIVKKRGRTHECAIFDHEGNMRWVDTPHLGIGTQTDLIYLNPQEVVECLNVMSADSANMMDRITSFYSELSKVTA